MTPSRFELISELFRAACRLKPDERDRYLSEACGEDDQLRAQIEEMLRADGLMGSAELDAGDRRTEPRMGTRSGIPRRIGRYAIRRVLGTGGMGTVYLAVQEQPKRTVAVKVMNRGVTSREALRRFEFESQILARLRHPNVAQVYEAGTHDDPDVPGDGVPYFAMEYIPGARPITEYANRRKLDTRERLRLFARVCDAVYHGHQKGIIHRDLKPSNILIDSSGEPKIIDFGVARATDSDLAVTSLLTDVGQLIGTLQYMSPEQLEADPEDLDTRSDVYAMGVVAYELLTGRLPYDLSQVAIHEAARVIREETPARPSSIDHTISGDVETIAFKAMEKDRTRRYASMVELRDDIDRYLHDQPIWARPASATYRLRMFARRHRALVSAALITVMTLVLGLAGTSGGLWWALQEQEESEHWNATLRELLRSSFNRAVLDPFSVDCPSIEGLEFVESQMLALVRDSRTNARSALLEAEICTSLGDGYAKNGHEYGDDAARLWLSAFELREGRAGPRSDASSEAWHNLGRARRIEGDLPQAEDAFRRACGIRAERATLEPGSARRQLEYVVSLSRLADTVARLGRLKDAQGFLESALSVSLGAESDGNAWAQRIRLELASCLYSRGLFDEAHALYEASMKTGDHARNRARHILEAHLGVARCILHDRRALDAERVRDALKHQENARHLVHAIGFADHTMGARASVDDAWGRYIGWETGFRFPPLRRERPLGDGDGDGRGDGYGRGYGPGDGHGPGRGHGDGRGHGPGRGLGHRPGRGPEPRHPLDEVLILCQRALDRDAEDNGILADVHTLRALVALEREQFAEALDEAHAAVAARELDRGAAHPDSRRTRLILARVMLAQGDSHAATRIIEVELPALQREVDSHDPDLETARSLSMQLADAG